MTVRSQKLNQIAARIRSLKSKESASQKWNRRTVFWISRWYLMVLHEFILNDVRIRAESLAFLMIFSLLPLIAGLFFLFSVFSQFGLVQEAIQTNLELFLQKIPLEHRNFVQDYVIRFKDAYLSTLKDNSGSIGIFALFILIWVGLQTFNNIDRTLNYIWSSDRQRPFLEQFRNFLVVSVAAPIAIIGGLSIPLILRKIYLTKYFLDQVPFLLSLMNEAIPFVLTAGTFVLLYRYVPVRQVKWRSALGGAIFSTVTLQIVNTGIQYYFRFGTQSAYGKAAVIPILGFWIYLVWIVIILGAEVSFLIQNQRDILRAKTWSPSFEQGEALLRTLAELSQAFKLGKGPMAFEKLRDRVDVESESLRTLLDFLLSKKWVLAAQDPYRPDEHLFTLGQDLSEVNVRNILEELFDTSSIKDDPVGKIWTKGKEAWLESFDQVFIPNLANGARKKNQG